MGTCLVKISAKPSGYNNKPEPQIIEQEVPEPPSPCMFQAS